MSLPLQGLRIVITRPQHQATALSEQLRALGAEPLLLPTIEIVACNTTKPLADSYHWVIFISANAVNFGLKQLPTLTNYPLAAIGLKTAEHLKQHCPTPLTPNAPYNSEAFLKLPELQALAGKTIAIVKGEGGRGLLQKTLRERGAHVIEYDVYQRQLPTAPNQAIIEQIQNRQVNHILVTSEQSLNHLIALVGLNTVQQTSVILGSKRQLECADRLGLKITQHVSHPSDQAYIDQLLS
ncbi:MAG: uroporphyrinogen-III synthase [Methylococcales bacterium]|nr:uroporphyrinogen-III synthase [Methylococcales bacterium]MBT7444273.1 uroporphyrinogen-III synthase [Methylococcales bacterium]